LVLIHQPGGATLATTRLRAGNGLSQLIDDLADFIL
jgi:hypothetical protein